MKLVNIFTISSIFIIILLTGCTNKYDIKISNIDFQHEGGLDVMTYKLTNPTNQDLSCKININSPQKNLFSDSVDVKSGEEKNMTSEVKFPNGKTNVIFNTVCKPI